MGGRQPQEPKSVILTSEVIQLVQLAFLFHMAAPVVVDGEVAMLCNVVAPAGPSGKFCSMGSLFGFTDVVGAMGAQLLGVALEYHNALLQAQGKGNVPCEDPSAALHVGAGLQRAR